VLYAAFTVFPSVDWKSSILELQVAAEAHARRKCEALFEKSRRVDLERMRGQVADVRRVGEEASEETALELELVIHDLVQRFPNNISTG
jgi:hypothetical protein